ncbi:MAG TPA: hypothetical protein VFG86_15355 [Chloroflexota bacterium]|jgi:hypothetical protein|nr:hypothetical protein [Chloroflexota bacterium]
MMRLAFVAVAGPLAWSLHNLLSVALVDTACHVRFGLIVLNGLTVLAALLAASGAATSLRLAPASNGQRFVRSMALPTDSFFVLVILAEGVPNLLLNPCWS